MAKYKYEVVIRGIDKLLTVFESNWRYQEGEVLFYKTREKEEKRIFEIKKVTHDVFDDGETLVRLTVMEKKNDFGE